MAAGAGQPGYAPMAGVGFLCTVPPTGNKVRALCAGIIDRIQIYNTVV